MAAVHIWLYTACATVSEWFLQSSLSTFFEYTKRLPKCPKSVYTVFIGAENTLVKVTLLGSSQDY